MVTVKIKKPIGKFRPGDVTEVTDAKAYYWRKIGVSETHFEVEEQPEESAEKATINKKPEKVTIKKPPSKKRIKKPGSNIK